MRPYRQYTPDQAFLLPPSLSDLIPEGDPVFFLREVIQRLDLDAFHRSYRCERGQPPYHPELMIGLYLYGAMRRTYSSRRLAELCSRDVACMYLAGRATPDFHTISEFRQRFTEELKGLFLQVLVLCREAGLVRLGHVSLDGTKVRANASKHKAMSYARMQQREPILAAEVARWLEESRREDEAEDAEHGPDDDGWSLPEEMKESSKWLERIRQGKARLEEQAREKAEVEGKDPAEAVVAAKAQTNFTDPPQPSEAPRSGARRLKGLEPDPFRRPGPPSHHPPPTHHSYYAFGSHTPQPPPSARHHSYPSQSPLLRQAPSLPALVLRDLDFLAHLQGAIGR